MTKHNNDPFEFNKALDGTFLNELFEGDLPYAIVLFKDFLDEMPKSYHDMQAAFDDSDWKGLKSAAHKAKTLFAYVGLNSISTQLQALEMACGYSDKTDTIPSLFQGLVKERKGVESLITEEIKRLEAFYEK